MKEVKVYDSKEDKEKDIFHTENVPDMLVNIWELLGKIAEELKIEK